MFWLEATILVVFFGGLFPVSGFSIIGETCRSDRSCLDRSYIGVPTTVVKMGRPPVAGGILVRHSHTSTIDL